EPSRTILSAGLRGQAIVSFPLGGTSSGVNGSGVVLSIATKRSPSRGRSRLASVWAHTTRGARTRQRPSSIAARRRIPRTCHCASRISGLIDVVPQFPTPNLPRIMRLRASEAACLRQFYGTHERLPGYMASQQAEATKGTADVWHPHGV